MTYIIRDNELDLGCSFFSRSKVRSTIEVESQQIVTLNLLKQTHFKYYFHGDHSTSLMSVSSRFKDDRNESLQNM